MEVKADKAGWDFRFSLASAVFSTACHHCDWPAKWRWLLAPFPEVGPAQLCSLSQWQCLLASSWTVNMPNQISSSLTSFTSYQVYQLFPASQMSLEVVFYRWPFPTSFTRSKIFRAEGNKDLLQWFTTMVLLHLYLVIQLWDVSQITVTFPPFFSFEVKFI